MPIAPDALVIGLTGPFGSGATTSAQILKERMQFTSRKLSEAIRIAFGAGEPTRAELQALGDELREKSGSRVLAERACEALNQDATTHTRIVFDGIRNLGEIHYFRKRFGIRFFLFALECPGSERWERLRPKYEEKGQGFDDFSADDKRDKDEEGAYGQQVELCVDHSDVLINNDDLVTTVQLRKKLLQFVRLVSGDELRYPSPHEILMNQAYSASHGSKCLKRQVGAILVNAAPGEMGEVVGTGFNENPSPTAPCVEEPKYGADIKSGKAGFCYRDIVRFDILNKYAKDGVRCTKCGEPLTAISNREPPWKCAKCKAGLDKPFFPERAMTWCTAVHAEVAAILAAGHRARGTTLYTTTFPCFQCAEKITQAGVKAIVFSEPYPDTAAADRLTLAGIDTARFEGVRSSKFHAIFWESRRSLEKLK